MLTRSASELNLTNFTPSSSHHISVKALPETIAPESSIRELSDAMISASDTISSVFTTLPAFDAEHKKRQAATRPQLSNRLTAGLMRIRLLKIDIRSIIKNIACKPQPDQQAIYFVTYFD
ncbi:MAG TPA: hypothetical protein IAD42_01225 [Candidatus Scatomorpha pullistercoris]|uniref:Uncharacterized protein n=1 Tax=Candidatus Scatomorpha pullistercoris TaxID=2840929 RepID=A0A9D1G402_9FIRM|nr:hypothetical protein [Candidatus Scatomorpha pullistercoris]